MQAELCNELIKTTVCGRVNTKVRTELPTLKYLILGHKSLTRQLHLSKSDEAKAKILCRLLLECAWQGGLTTATEIIKELLTLQRPWTVSLNLKHQLICLWCEIKLIAEAFHNKLINKSLIITLLFCGGGKIYLYEDFLYCIIYFYGVFIL